MDEAQRKAREYVDFLAAKTGLSYTELAKRAEIAASTLTRFMNGKVKHALSTKTLEKLRQKHDPSGNLASVPSQSSSSRMKSARSLARAAVAPFADSDEALREDLESALTGIVYETTGRLRAEGLSNEEIERVVPVFVSAVIDALSELFRRNL